MKYDEMIIRALKPMSQMPLEKAKEVLSSNSASFAVLFTKAMRADEVDLDDAIEHCYYKVAYPLLYAGKALEKPTLEDVCSLLFEAHLKREVTSKKPFKMLESVMYEQLVIKQAPNYSLFTELMLKLKDAQGID